MDSILYNLQAEHNIRSRMELQQLKFTFVLLSREMQDEIARK